jgi:hypothetical protein
MTLAGFPHSEISGSTLVCNLPELIAAYHVLHRLLTPRHPPFALSSLIEILGARSRLLRRPPASERGRPPEQQHSSLCSCQRSCIAGASVPARRSVSTRTAQNGGDNRDRTGNLRLAKPALSQLSYIPRNRSTGRPPGDSPPTGAGDVGLGRFELPTSRLSGVRSNQLSYRPDALDHLRKGRRAQPRGPARV